MAVIVSFKLYACIHACIHTFIHRYTKNTSQTPLCSEFPFLGAIWFQSFKVLTRNPLATLGCDWGVKKHKIQAPHLYQGWNTSVEGSHMGVSENRGTPKWMVYNGKPYYIKWMIWGYRDTTIFGNIHMFIPTLGFFRTWTHLKDKGFQFFQPDFMDLAALNLFPWSAFWKLHFATVHWKKIDNPQAI